MATRAELEQQLATIQAGLLDFSALGEEAFFKKTGQTKLTKKDIPRYTDVYNPIFESVKDIQFDVAADVSTSTTADTAFYVFDPARTAERQAKEQIKSIEDFNASVATQEQQIQAFLASQQQSAKESVFQKYLSGILNPKIPKGGINPFEWDTIDLNTPSGLAKWKATKRSDKAQVGGITADGRATQQYTYYIKLTPEQSIEKRKTTEAIERIRFMASPTLQKTYADIYTKELQTNITTLAKKEEKAAKIKSQIELLTTALNQPGARINRLNKQIKDLNKQLSKL